VGADIISDRLAGLRLRNVRSITKLASDTALKNALRAAAATDEMRAAQLGVTLDRYMAPAERECETRGFSTPLSLAVVYDSMIHGSWDRIAARAGRPATHGTSEKEWILTYVRTRHACLRVSIVSGLPRIARASFSARSLSRTGS